MAKRKKLEVREDLLRPIVPAADVAEEPLLAPQRAFVVQFYPQTDPTTEHFVGRVEHVVSGRRCRFESVERLVAFVGQMLTAGESSLKDT